MDNQHRQIKGYRELTQGEIDLMNRIKEAGAQLGSLVAEVAGYADAQRAKSMEHTGTDESEGAARSHLEVTEPARWVAIAKTDLQKGLMALTRAVAQPTFF